MNEIIKIPQQLAKIGFRGGNMILNYCEQPEVLRKVLSEMFYNSLALYSKEVKEDNIRLMMPTFIEKYQFESLDLFLQVNKDLVSGKKKIYGMVTPNDIEELFTEKLEEIAIQRERDHEKNKGYGEQENR